MKKVLIYSKNKKLIGGIKQTLHQGWGNVVIENKDRWTYCKEDVMSIDPDIVFIDLHKPYFTGSMIVKEINELDLKYKIIVLTNGVDEESIFYSWINGANAILLNSKIRKELLIIIKRVNTGLKILGAQVPLNSKYYTMQSESKRKKELELNLSEIKLIYLLSIGHSKKEIASALDLKYSVVKYRCDKIRKKSGKPKLIDVISQAKIEHIL